MKALFGMTILVQCNGFMEIEDEIRDARVGPVHPLELRKESRNASGDSWHISHASLVAWINRWMHGCDHACWASILHAQAFEISHPVSCLVFWTADD
jgi:hypothetical protein